MTWTQQKRRSLIIGVFNSVPGAASIIERLLQAKLHPATLSLLCSARTEGQLRGARPVASLGGRVSGGTGLARVASTLGPLVPFGAPASDLLATGLLKAALVTAGVGSGRGLEQALRELGIGADAASEVTRRITGGAVLVGARFDDLDEAAQRAAALLEQEAVLAFRLHVSHSPSGTRVVARPTPQGNSRAP